MKRSAPPSSGYYPSQNHQPGRTGNGGRKKTRKLRPRWVWLAMMLGCLAVFITCAVLLVRYFADIASSKQTSAELRTIYQEAATVEVTQTAVVNATVTAAAEMLKSSAPSTAPTGPVPAGNALAGLWPNQYEGNPHLVVSEQFLNLRDECPDIVGWLKIDGLLDEPVVQRDNEYYLTHDYLGKKNVTGALFLDENCNLKNVPVQMVVHGHNMKEGAMFGSLKKYKVKDAAFYKQNAFIEFNTIYENGTYVIFAVLEADIRSGEPRYFPFWQYASFAGQEDFDRYITQAKAYSHYRCGVDVRAGDRLLTLATCLGSDDNKRLVVMARRVREDEDRVALNAAILSTSNR